MAAATEEMPSKAVPIEFRAAHKLRRAMRRASRPRFGAACIWCGHAYRLGQYTHAAEDSSTRWLKAGWSLKPSRITSKL